MGLEFRDLVRLASETRRNSQEADVRAALDESLLTVEEFRQGAHLPFYKPLQCSFAPEPRGPGSLQSQIEV